jgi:CBS domain-containing protein
METPGHGGRPGPDLGELLAALGRAAPAEVARLRRQGDAAVAALLPAGPAGAASAALNDAALHRLLELASGRLGPPPCRFAWLALGSWGRREQLVRTDLEHALVLEDDDPARRTWFLRLATDVVRGMEACGFRPDAAGLSPHRADWCAPLADWRARFRTWMREPVRRNVMWSTIFFDFRPAAGDPALGQALQEEVRRGLSAHPAYLSFLAKDGVETLAPLGLFGRFAVAWRGERRGEMDLKERLLLPLVDAARVLALQHRRVELTGTAERLAAVAAVEPDRTALLGQAAEDFDWASRLRAREAARRGDDGRWLRPGDLPREDRERLRAACRTLGRLQALIRVRFQTDWLRW